MKYRLELFRLKLIDMEIYTQKPKKELRNQLRG